MDLSYQKSLNDLADRFIDVFKGLGGEFNTAVKIQEDVFNRMIKSVADW